MDAEKYKRTVSLMCPTCGGTQFASVDCDNSESEQIKCMSCGRETTRDDLIRENSENLSEHVRELGKEASRDVTAEIKKQLTAAFKNSKFIKVR